MSAANLFPDWTPRPVPRLLTTHERRWIAELPEYESRVIHEEWQRGGGVSVRRTWTSRVEDKRRGPTGCGLITVRFEWDEERLARLSNALCAFKRRVKHVGSEIVARIVECKYSDMTEVRRSLKNLERPVSPGVYMHATATDLCATRDADNCDRSCERGLVRRVDHQEHEVCTSTNTVSPELRARLAEHKRTWKHKSLQGAR